MPTARMRADEEFAKSRLDTFLRSRFPLESNLWKPGNEPPDYYLTLNQIEYAVDIRSLTDKFVTPRKEIDVEGLYASCKDFAKKIQTEALKSGRLSGEYCVWFLPAQIDFYGKQKVLKKQVLDFIRNTQTEDVVPTTYIDVDGLPYCAVYKTEGKGQRIHVVGYPFVAKWEGEVNAEAYQTLQNAIDEKVTKLATLQEPKILVLISNSMFSDMEIYRNFLPKLKNHEFFNAVFITSNRFEPHRDYMLYTADPRWK